MKEKDESGKPTGRSTTWQDLALKGETQSIWEYLHEDAPDATYNLSDVRLSIHLVLPSSFATNTLTTVC